MSCQIKGKYDIMPLFVSMLVTKVDLQKRIEKRLEHFNCKSTGKLNKMVFTWNFPKRSELKLVTKAQQCNPMQNLFRINTCLDTVQI